MRILSKEKRVGVCGACGVGQNEFAFVKLSRGVFEYYCYECAGLEESNKELKKEIEIIEIDEDRLAREEIMEVMLQLATEDEVIFKDPRLTFVKSFEHEILEGKISSQLENYLKFNGNDIKEVLKLREFAVNAVGRKDEKYTELAELYTTSRLKKLPDVSRDRMKVLLCDKDIQMLNSDYKVVWDNIELIRNEALRDSSQRRYDNIEDIYLTVMFLDLKKYLTEQQVRRLKSFYYEMVRRNKADVRAKLSENEM